MLRPLEPWAAEVRGEVSDSCDIPWKYDRAGGDTWGLWMPWHLCNYPSQASFRQLCGWRFEAPKNTGRQSRDSLSGKGVGKEAPCGHQTLLS